MSEELKPCPCCGRHATLYHYEDDRGNHYRISCDRCCIETDIYYHKDALIEEWNTRHEPEELPGWGEVMSNPTYEELEAFALWCQSLQPQAVDIMRKHGMKFTDLSDPWQKLAFTFYSDLCEIHSKVTEMFEEDEE